MQQHERGDEHAYLVKCIRVDSAATGTNVCSLIMVMVCSTNTTVKVTTRRKYYPRAR
ncbi:MAG: hypothetical protein J2P17_15255 [Mycobacterium sp.]|nr:hypothetical protein [Mycobacterium sp.]